MPLTFNLDNMTQDGKKQTKLAKYQKHGRLQESDNNAPLEDHPSKTRQEVLSAHSHCIYNEQEILASDSCGCFFCLAIFQPSEITYWLETTAFCPKCEIDSVIGSKSGYPISKEFLKEMKGHWFRGT